MNQLITLAQQPTSVLVALFNCIASKKLKDGQINPVCINICKILNKRGYDIEKLDFEDGKHYSPDRSQNYDEKSCLYGKGSKQIGSSNKFIRPPNKQSK